MAFEFAGVGTCFEALQGRGDPLSLIIEHWDIVDLRPDLPGIQFLIQLSNPGSADQSQGAIAPPGIFLGNPGVVMATTHCPDAA